LGPCRQSSRRSGGGSRLGLWAAQQALGRTAAAVQVGFFAFALQGGWGFLVHITRNWTPGTQLKVPAVCFGRLNTVHGGVCKTACAFGTGRISGMLLCSGIWRACSCTLFWVLVHFLLRPWLHFSLCFCAFNVDIEIGEGSM